MKKPSLVLHICIIILLSGCTTTLDKPNFIFILVDDMGWTDLGCYGSSFNESPYIDQLAAEGMRFTNAYAACPVCSPTRASIMTGKYPSRLDITDWIPGRQNHPKSREFMKVDPPEFKQELPLEELTIAEALREQGYRTAFVGKWHLGSEGYWPEDQGFEINRGGWTSGAPYYRKYDVNTDVWYGESGYFSPYQNPRLVDGPEGEYLTDRLTDESIQFIEAKREEPFFLYLAFYTVHNPMHGKDSLIQKYSDKADREQLAGKETFVVDKPWMDRPDPGQWRERIIQSNPVYAAMVNSLDENIGRILDKLDELELDDKTIIIFTSDNGGTATSESSPTTNLPLRAGKGWLYEGGIREPLIIKWPGVVSPGSVSNEIVTSTDYYPTILEMAGLPTLPQQHTDGISLKPVLEDSAPLAERTIFWHYPHYSNQGGLPGSAVRKGNWKLIEYFEDGKLELYNLVEDLEETTNLAEQEPELTREMHELMQKFQDETKAKIPKPV